MKKDQIFLFEKFQVLEVKFSIYLNRRVFVIDFEFLIVIFISLYVRRVYIRNSGVKGLNSLLIIVTYMHVFCKKAYTLSTDS